MRFTFALLAIITCAGSARAADASLMPVPVKIQPASGSFAVNSYFTVDTGGSADARLAASTGWFLARISRQTGIPFIPAANPADVRRLRIECIGGPPYPTLGEDESYTLDVSDTEARLKAATVDGAIHGLATFAQLIQAGPNGFQVAAVHIEDRPRFPWRGLMLDSCRHWMPVEVVKRNLDAMAAVKLNVFHWHLSEDQGFRVESKKYPKLQEFGSDGNYYTQDQIRDVVAYARDRAIRVIPEFDMPGHTGAWFPGYPELAAGAGPYSIATQYGVFDPVMDPTKEETYAFIDGFIGEMAQLFPDPYFHVGGDEVRDVAWKQSHEHSGLRQGARPGGRARYSGLLQPAAAEDRAEVREDHGGLGRDSCPRPAHRRRDPILARAEVIGRCCHARVPRHSLFRLLPRPSSPGELPLRRRPAQRRYRQAHARTDSQGAGRRSLHVGGVEQLRRQWIRASGRAPR